MISPTSFGALGATECSAARASMRGSKGSALRMQLRCSAFPMSRQQSSCAAHGTGVAAPAAPSDTRAIAARSRRAPLPLSAN